MSDLQFNDLVLRDYDGFAIPQRRGDRYINATAMCQANGKQLGHYTANQSTKEFVDELSRSLGIPSDVLVQIRVNGSNDERGTWVHPRVAIHLAQWISARFAVAVSGWVEDLLTTGVVAIKAVDPLLAILEVATRTRQAQLDLERQQKAIEQRVDALQDTITNQSGWMSIMGRAKLLGLKLTTEQAGRLGKEASRICKARGIAPQKITDQRFGSVGIYPDTVLADMEGEFFAVVRSNLLPPKNP